MIQINDRVEFKNEISKRAGVVIAKTAHWNEVPGKWLYLIDLDNGQQKIGTDNTLKIINK